MPQRDKSKARLLMLPPLRFVPPPPPPREASTSEDSEFRVDRDLPDRVLCHALVHVLIPGCPQRLDPQHGPRTLVKLDRLPRARGER